MDLEKDGSINKMLVCAYYRSVLYKKNSKGAQSGDLHSVNFTDGTSLDTPPSPLGAGQFVIYICQCCISIIIII